MHSDCTFRIGRDHAICQDYGVARTSEPTFVILADGCSSSPDTDLGARLLVRSAERLLPDWLRATNALGGEDLNDVGAVGAYHRQVVLAARDHSAGLGLEACCLDATLLTLVVQAGQWLAMLYGDGVLALGDREARGTPRVRVRSIEFSGGYPNYPSYRVDAGRRRAFEQLRGNRCRLDPWLLNAEGAVRDDTPLGTVVDDCYVATGSVESLEWLAVLTDGSSSFTCTESRERTSSRVPLPAVLSELLAFKSLSGVFVQRRVQRFLKECAARGWQHHDDLGVGAIALR